MIKYVVINTTTDRYYCSGRRNSTPDIEKAKSYVYRSGADYRCHLLNYFGFRRGENFKVLKVKVSMEIVND